MPRPFRRGGGRPRRRPAGGNNRGRGGNNRRGPSTGGFDEQGGNGVAVAQRSIELPPTMTVEELATLLSLRPAAVIGGLIKNGIFATVNQMIDFDTASSVAAELGFEVTEQSADADEDDGTVEAEAEALTDEEMALLVSRPPVVTVMGHVDHGKTSLLDRIRQARVATGEAGGITQHIGAYQVDVEVDGETRKITFLDTPGHEAFTAMRARGAQATDIAILVVAADDGVMPQTVEAIDHARAAKVPIVVALNKMDREDINPDRVKQQLAEHNVIIEEYGGDVPIVPVSARTGDGIDDLLTTVALMADVAELKADPNVPAAGLVVEAKLDKSRGPVATVLVQRGTLNVSDIVVIGKVTGKLRALFNDKGKRIKSAGPSTPVEVLGLSAVPSAGDRLAVAPDEKTARQQAELYQRAAERDAARQAGGVPLDDIFTRMKEGEVKDLNLVVKADVQGSIEPLVTSLQRLQEEGLRVKVLHSGTGNVNRSDVMLASVSNAIIIAFNVRAEPDARSDAETQRIDIRSYDVIYNVVEDVRKALLGLLGPRFQEVVHGHAEIRQIFPVRKGGAAAGCLVMDGQILSSDSARVKRGDRVLWEGKIATLRRVRDDVREVSAGMECGIVLDGFSEFRESDVIESYGQQQINLA
jgi:translation initiation factor IF-2